MDDSANFSISSAGGVEDGFEVEAVQIAFAELFGTSPEKAAAYTDKQKLIRKDLTSANAEAVRKRLQKIGLSVVVHEPDALSLLPTGDEKDEPVAVPARPRGFCCPKCDLEQERSEECVGCGIIFEKFNVASGGPAAGASSQDQGKARALAVAKAKAKARSDDHDGVQPLSYIAPILVMIAGAFLWKTIAVGFDRELGVIAWGIGGAIGAAAVFTGARGTGAAIACALLVVVSIFGGKYLYMSSFEQELAEILNSEEFSEQVNGYYDTINTEAAEFALIDKDDVSVKQFMFEYDYTGARSAAYISEEELDEFRQYVQPMLEHSVEQAFTSKQSIAEAAPELNAAFAVSIWSLVLASIGLIDMLFLFFGCGTAFRMVSAAS